MDESNYTASMESSFSQVIRSPNLRHEVTTYEAIAQMCSAARDALVARDIAIHPESELGKLLRHAGRMAQMHSEQVNDVTVVDMVRLTHASRIASAIVAVQQDQGAQESLRRITRNSLNLSRADNSAAKDALWELELAARLKARGVLVTFEEPDLQVQLGAGPFGVACKRVNSLNGVETSLRKGAQQIARSGMPGGIAFSIDALAGALSDTPELKSPNGSTGGMEGDLMLVALTPEVASKTLALQNERFIRRFLLRHGPFLARSKCSMVFVNSSCTADITAASQRLNSFHQVGVWLYRGDDQLSDPMFREMHQALSA